MGGLKMPKDDLGGGGGGGLQVSIKGAMSPHTYARPNENKLEKVGPTFYRGLAEGWHRS